MLLRIPVAALAALCGIAEAQVQTSFDPFDEPLEAVITPTRLRQSLHDVPASVTVITAAAMRDLGISSLPEALRLVPGMAVVHATGPDYQISYHGTNGLSPRRMNVLIDGISVYRPAFSEVIWSQLPVAIDDIERIEITRGPSSAAYGPNSMLAVVNIITKQPSDAPSTHASFLVDSRGSRKLTGQASGRFGNWTASATAEREQNDGFDRLSQDESGHDGLQVNRVRLRAQSKLTSNRTIDVQALVAQGTAEVPFADNFQRTYPDRRFVDGYVSALWTERTSANQEYQLQLNHTRQASRQRWTTCLPAVALLPEMYDLWRLSPSYTEAILSGRSPSGGSPEADAQALRVLASIQRLGDRALQPMCGMTNQDATQSRTEVEVQSTLQLAGNLRLVSGLGYRQQRGESQTYLAGSQRSHVAWAFGNLEARPGPSLTLNAGAFAERDSLGPAPIAPRFGVNWHLSPTQTVRLAYARGSRSPDIQEQQARWTYTFTNVTPPLLGSTTARLYQSRFAPGGLDSERITSREVGYVANVSEYGLIVDARLFRDSLSSLISERTNLAGALPTNDGAVTLRGGEIQADLHWSPRWAAFFKYALLENRDSTNSLERTMFSRHSAALGGTYVTSNGWRLSFARYAMSGDGIQQSRYGRSDVVALREWVSADWRWSATVGLQRLDKRSTSYSIGSPEALRSSFDGRTNVYLQLSMWHL